MTKGAKIGRPRESNIPRVQLSASVAGETDQQLYRWLAKLLKSSDSANVGRVLDHLVAFGQKYSFHRTLPKKMPQRPSEVATGASIQQAQK